MKLFKFVLISAAFALFALACNNTNGPAPTNTAGNKPMPATTAAPTPDEWAEVRLTYHNICANCHKDDGTGGDKDFGDGGKPLRVPTLKEGKTLNEDDAEYIEQIANGGDGMPAFRNKLKDDKIKQLVAFIRKEFQGKDVKLPAAAAEPAAKPNASPAKPGAK